MRDDFISRRVKRYMCGSVAPNTEDYVYRGHSYSVTGDDGSMSAMRMHHAERQRIDKFILCEEYLDESRDIPGLPTRKAVLAAILDYIDGNYDLMDQLDFSGAALSA